MATRRAIKRIFSGKRTSYHSPDRIFSDQNFTRDFAVFVQLVNRNNILMRGYLEHAVGGRIDDKRTFFHRLPAIVFDNFGTGIRFVAQCLSSSQSLEVGNNFVRETVRIGRHRITRNKPRNFPVPYRRVFAGRLLFQPSKASGGHFYSAAHSVDIEQSDFFEIGTAKFVA